MEMEFLPCFFRLCVFLSVRGALWQRTAVCPWCPCKKWQFYGAERIPTLRWPLHHPVLTPPRVTTSLFFSKRMPSRLRYLTFCINWIICCLSSRRCLIEKIRSQIASKDSDTFPWLSSSLPCLWTHKTKSPLHSFPLFTPCLAQPPKQTQLRTDKQTNRQTANKRQTRIKETSVRLWAWTVDTWKVILKLIKLIWC